MSASNYTAKRFLLLFRQLVVSPAVYPDRWFYPQLSIQTAGYISNCLLLTAVYPDS